MALGLNVLKDASNNFRAVTDHLIFKAQGIMGFPSDLSWQYGHLTPHYTRRMKQFSSYSVAKQYQTPHKRKQKNNQNNKRTPKNTPNQKKNKIKKYGEG